MNWKQSLDRYLTTPPEDGFSDYCEAVVDRLSDQFYQANESWVLNDNDLCDKWLNKLYQREHVPSQAAKIIERAFTLFVQRS